MDYLDHMPDAVLVHGWDPAFYNNVLSVRVADDQSMAWSKSPEFLALLSRHFCLAFCNLPGFCCVEEPSSHAFAVSDFANALASKLQQYSSYTLMGFSFGAAVALECKVRFRLPHKIILISPAIKRRQTVKSHLARLMRKFVPGFLRQRLKSAYQGTVSKYYRLGTPFLRSTYDKIAREDLTLLLSRVPAGDLFLIFGENDTEAPWQLIRDTVEKEGHKYKIIAGAGHAVTRTHPQQVVTGILEFLQHN